MHSLFTTLKALKTKISVIKEFLEFAHSFKILTIFSFPMIFILKPNEFDDFIFVLFGYYLLSFLKIKRHV